MEFIVESAGRLDATISEQNEELSRNKIQALIKNGSVCVNGVVQKKPAHSVCEGDEVSVDIATEDVEIETVINPVDQNLPVLYEDDSLMILNKPAGIAVHPGHAMDAAEETLLSGISYLFSERQIPFRPDSVLVHRLDKPTTGCICIAKDPKSFAALQKQFQERSVQKNYVAIVSGVPEHASATIDAPIGRNVTDRTKMSILKTSHSRDAQTSYTVVDHTHYVALLSCDLHTGRTHQIRVHLTSIDHPILGDDTYNTTTSMQQTEEYGIQNLCLHARSLKLCSPSGGEIEVQAPLPDSFSAALGSSSLQPES